MLEAESRWLGAALSELPAEAFPLVNLGSSTESFRRGSHPWIHQKLFEPLQVAGRSVVHVDLKKAPGVDLVADLSTSEGRASIHALGGRSILCTNLLEHLPITPGEAAAHIEQLVPPGGWLVVSVPHVYPPHADPIDNMYRPDPSELAALFTGFDVVEQQDVRCRRAAYYFADNGQRWPRYVARMAAPFIRPSNWWMMAKAAPRPVSAACVVLRRSPVPQDTVRDPEAIPS